MNWGDIKHTRTADVYQQAALVGQITRTRQGSGFEYFQDYLDKTRKNGGIAFHLPVTTKRYEIFGVNLHTYFAGLLPEGMRLKALTRAVKTSEDDLLSLLIAAGPDCIGDVSIVVAGYSLEKGVSTVEFQKIGESIFSVMLEQSLAYEKREGPARECNIPGIQEKISSAVISFPLRGKRKPRSYIIKLNPPDKPGMVENEAFFLRMAGDCGLAASEASLVYDREKAPGLLVARFDRIFSAALKTEIKVHQEDACQFLDRYPADKYSIKCSEIAEGIMQWCSAPIIEIAKFIRMQAFSYLIANGDMHAKNVSIQVSPHTKRVELTPAYDLLSTLPYGDQRMALQLEGRDDNLKRGHFLEFGRRYGVRAAVVHSMLDLLCERSKSWTGRLGEIGLTEKKRNHLQSIMEKRCEDLEKT
jgi:serine/threonine-protein kinase HipA